MRLRTPKNRKREEVLYLQKSTMHISKLYCSYVSYFRLLDLTIPTRMFIRDKLENMVSGYQDKFWLGLHRT